MRLAVEHDHSDRLHIVSLGQAQGPIASKFISTAVTKGLFFV